MNIELATKSQLNNIKNIVDTTIKEIYPLYYPLGAVDFFIQHHSNDKIISDIEKNLVYIMKLDNLSIGTVTIEENHINRFFILPRYQSRGYGSILFKFTEDTIFKNHDSIVLDTSLPSKSFYLKRGYYEVEYQKILTPNGDYLCYDIMSKIKRYPCPCCNYKTFTEPIKECWGDICEVCYWEIDFFIKDDNSPSNANHGLTLNKARENFKKFGVCEQSMLKNVRKPFDYEL